MHGPTLRVRFTEVSVKRESTVFQTKKFNFPYPFSDLAFKQKLCYHYLDSSANKKFFKFISNSHIFLSFLLFWN